MVPVMEVEVGEVLVPEVAADEARQRPPEERMFGNWLAPQKW